MVTQSQRQKLFDGFWKIADFDVQNAYLTGCVKVVEVKRRYTSNPSASRRRHSRVYYVQNGGISSRICKTAFMRIHSISNGRLSRALKAVEVSEGSPHQDQRGRHEPINKTPAQRIDSAKSHIESFPSFTSHYSRSDNPNRRYLTPELTLSKMYVLYREYCASKSVEPVSEWVYQKVFNEEYNLSFGQYVTLHTCTSLILTQLHAFTDLVYIHTLTDLVHTHTLTHTRTLVREQIHAKHVMSSKFRWMQKQIVMLNNSSC